MNMPGNEAMMPGNGAANMNAGPFEKMEIVQSHIKVQLIYKSSVGHPAISNTDVLIDFLEEHKNELKEIHACTGGAGASILNWLPEMQSYFQDPLKEDEVGITVEYDQDHDKSTPCHKGGSKQIDVLLAGLKDGKVSKIEVEYYKNSDKIEYKIENEDLNIKK